MRPARVALALAVAAAGAACGVIGAGMALTDAQQVIADMEIGPSTLKGAHPKGADLTIVGTVDHADRRYRAGEPVTLSVEVSKAASVAVLRVMPDGTTTLIFPNRTQTNAQLSANSPVRIPAPGAPFRIAADKPGTLLFEFVASGRGAAWLFHRKPGGSADFAELGTTTRALAKDIVTSLRGGHGADTGADTAAAHLAVSVRDD
jgi:hypothetical protein